MTAATLYRQFQNLPIAERVKFRNKIAKKSEAEIFFEEEGWTMEEFDAEMRRRASGKFLSVEESREDIKRYIEKLKNEKAKKVSGQVEC